MLHSTDRGFYFNYGGQGLLHRSVIDQITANFLKIEELGAYSISANNWIETEKQTTRSVLGELLGVNANSITLTQNTTEGCNIALWSYPWQKGDHLLLSDCEHPGIIAIAQTLADRFGISYSFFPVFTDRDSPDTKILSIFEEQLTPQTKMVMVSHICWNTGQILPLESMGAICQQRGIWLAVDAAQSVGMIALNLSQLNVDFYGFTGHKWLGGPLGVGGLYVNPDRLEQAKPTFVGWRGLKNPQLKFEVASTTYPLLGALCQAIKMCDIPDRYDRIIEKSQYLWHKLQQLPQVKTICQHPPRSGLVTFTIEHHSADQISQHLEQHHKIYLRSIPHPPALRASVSDLTTITEIDHLIQTLANR